MASSPSDAVSSPLSPPHPSHRCKDRNTRYTTYPIHAPHWQQSVAIVMIRDRAHFQALSDPAARPFGVDWKSAFDETQRHLRWNEETGFYTARERWKTGAR